MTYQAANRLENVKMSSIRIMMEKVQEKRDQGNTVISLSAGEPDFPTPEKIKEAVKQALDENYTHYSSNRGNPQLRQEIAKSLKENMDLDYDCNSEILVTHGCQEALHNVLHSVINPKDEVLIFTPAFVSYVNLVEMCQGIPVELPLKAEDGFQINPDELRKVISPQTKLIIMNNPNNPTGAVYKKELLEEIAQIVCEKDVLLLTDEVYSSITYDQEFTSIASFPGMKERCFVVNGFSKIYAMTGWRLGYVACDQSMMDGVLRIHQYSSTSCSSFSQVGLARVMSSDEVKKDVSTMIEAFSKRRKVMMAQLDQIDSLSYVQPQGAFYMMVDVSKLGLNGEEFALRLLEEELVACVPASGFGKGCEHFVRLSFASSMEDIQEGCKRIAHFCQKICYS